MDKKKITRLMIDSVVKRGIENMADDPRRSIRKLADMGKQFSTGRFQIEITDIIQSILANENSPYYSLLENFFELTDHEIIRKFGINMGYNSWTYDARILREKNNKLSKKLPWCLIFRYNLEDENHISADFIKNTIKDALNYGIDSFIIMHKGGTICSDEILEIFEENPESGFFLFLEDTQLTASQILKLKKCGNTLISINADSDTCFNTCEILKDSKLLFGIHHFYDEDDFKDKSTDEIIENYLQFPTGMLFFIQKDTCKSNYGELIKDIRLEGNYPLFVWDLYNDINKIGQILTEEDNTVFEIGSGYEILKSHKASDTSLNIGENDSILNIF